MEEAGHIEQINFTWDEIVWDDVTVRTTFIGMAIVCTAAMALFIYCVRRLKRG
jgi:hypothetical protein